MMHNVTQVVLLIQHRKIRMYLQTCYHCLPQTLTKLHSLLNFAFLFLLHIHEHLPMLECQIIQIIPKTHHLCDNLYFSVYCCLWKAGLNCTCSDSWRLLSGTTPSVMTTTHLSILRRLVSKPHSGSGSCSRSKRTIKKIHFKISEV